MKPKKDTGPTRAEVAAMVDELGSIDQRLKLYAPDSKRADDIKKQLRALLEDSPPDAEASFPGDTYVAIVSARRFEKIVDTAAAYKVLGVKLFVSLAKLTVKAVEDHVPLMKRAKLITEERTGPRVVSTAFRSVPQEAKKVA